MSPTTLDRRRRHPGRVGRQLADVVRRGLVSRRQIGKVLTLGAAGWLLASRPARPMSPVPTSDTPPLQLATQNRLPLEVWPELASRQLRVGMQLRVLSGISLAAGWMGKDVSREEAIRKLIELDVAAIRDSFLKYLDAIGLDAGTSAPVVLDIEHPIHPAHFGRYLLDSRRMGIFEAFRRRVEVARSVLTRAPLSLYGVVLPQSEGRLTPSFLLSALGYAAAGSAGVFEALDFVSPVLYTRWGPSDDCGRNGDRRYCSLEASTRMALQASDRLAHRPLAPFMTLRVANSGSRDHARLLEIEAARLQLRIAGSDPNVRMLVYWVAPQAQNPNHCKGEEIARFFERLGYGGRAP